MPQVRIVAKNFMDMVAALPAMKLDQLYDSSFICEAVLRSLPPLAKKYVLQLLFIDTPVTAKSIEEWVLSDGISKHKVAIDRLLQLRVFIEVIDRKKEASYKLNPKFQSNMQRYLVHGYLTLFPSVPDLYSNIPSLRTWLALKILVYGFLLLILR
ncbi:putative transcription factor TFIIH subunit p52/Tfb2 [Dioscorea sansibarensis]